MNYSDIDINSIGNDNNNNNNNNNNGGEEEEKEEGGGGDDDESVLSYITNNKLITRFIVLVIIAFPISRPLITFRVSSLLLLCCLRLFGCFIGPFEFKVEGRSKTAGTAEGCEL